MKERKSFALDPDVKDFVDSQKNASKFVNHILRLYMINSFGGLTESQLKDFERVWIDIYPDIEDLVITERKTLPDRNYVVSDAIIKLFYDICIGLGMKVSISSCRGFITTKIIKCRYE